MMNMPQEWFEMKDARKQFFDKSVWIPLKASRILLKKGESGNLGYQEEYLGAGSIVVPLHQKVEVEQQIGWTDLGVRVGSSGYVEGDEYIPAYIYNRSNIRGEFLVMEERMSFHECNEWLLNPDLPISLGLKREGDVWVAPRYAYEEVIKMERNEEGCSNSILIKATYLKDYLCARKMRLYITSYRSRRQIIEDSKNITWTNPFIEKTGMDHWEGRVTAIHEGGEPYGGKFAVMHVGRADVDYDEDIPNYDFPTNEESIKFESWEGEFKGKKLYRIDGEFWRNEWIEPALKSTIICEEEEEPTSFFITDNAGTKESRETLTNSSSRWLWFKPTIVNEILKCRGSFLSWYTKDTGSIGCSPVDGVHFGVNSLGLINVYAKDIGLLPDWQQKVWAAYNIAPEGKVSSELLMSQMEASPAKTLAPEHFFQKGIEELNKKAYKKYGFHLIATHPEVDKILPRIHRFRATSREGLFELAKDIYRLTGERIDATKIKNFIKPDPKLPWRNLKAMEKLLALKLKDKIAYKFMTPFWGVYALRNADSHLPSLDDLNEAYEKCLIKQDQPFVIQGYQLVKIVVDWLYQAAIILED
jgi:curved DNA-binding protein CbpA